MIRVPQVETHEGLWKHRNVLDASTFNALYGLSQFLISPQHHRLNEETRVLKGENGENMKLAAVGSERSYSKLWHLPLVPGYWYQTNDTIAAWAYSQLKAIHPALRMMIARFRELEPFNDGREWIAYRGIFNHLKAGVPLEPHEDGSSGFELDIEKHSIYSSTIYFQLPDEGGYFWDELGFLQKPEVNMLLVNKSNRVMHGVTAGNADRLGFTIRWCPAEHLLLPGSPDKLFWKPPEV